MGIFDRLSTLLKSNINELISSAENPEEMLNQIIVDMRSQLVKAKQQVAAAIADEKRLRDQADAELRQAQDWENRAVLAVREGRDDLAKQALVRQNEHMTHGQALDGDMADASRRNREAQERAPRPQRQDRRGEAEEESAHRASASRTGAEADCRDHVVALGEVGVRGVRAHGRARSIRASARSAHRPRSTRSSRAIGWPRISSSSSKGRSVNDADFRLLQLKQQMGLLGCGRGWRRKQLGAGAVPGGASAAGPGRSGVAEPTLPGAGATRGPAAVPAGGASTTGSGSSSAAGSGDSIPTADVEELPDTRKPA